MVERLAKALVEIAQRPDVREKLRHAGFAATGRGPDAFARRIAEDVPKWKDVIEKARISPKVGSSSCETQRCAPEVLGLGRTRPNLPLPPQCIDLPPSTLMVCPVMKSLADDDRNMTAPTRSAGTCARSNTRPSTREAR